MSETADDDFFAAMARNLPFKKLSNFSKGTISVEDLEELLAMINSDMTPEEVGAVLGPQ